jgi:hypothetical protein
MTTNRPCRGPRSFDPVAVGESETEAWASYYRHEWGSFLRSAVAMVREGFGMSTPRTLLGAWWVLRANQQWAPFPDNDADGARRSMGRFYALVARTGGLAIDPVRAAAYEVEWWRVHRAHQHDEEVSEEQLVTALVDLYAYVYAAPRDLVRPAAAARVAAMDLSDAWVRGGSRREDPLLVAERGKLVESYAALRTAVGSAG